MTNSFVVSLIRSIDANRTVKDELTAAVESSRPRSRVSVTDLVNPMQAFFRWTQPEIRPSQDRLKLMMAGTGFHDVFGRIVSTEEFLEQLLEFEGIVGKVDIFEDVPVEVKTTSTIPSDIYKGRSSYFEQLGMYCAMAGKDTGRLFVYQRQNPQKPSELRVYETVFNNLTRITTEMVARRDMLQKALSKKDPSDLPQCEWMYRGCDYSKICNCRNALPLIPIVAREEINIIERNELAEELKQKLLESTDIETTFRLNDLVFPRKAAMLRIRGESKQDGEIAFDPEHRMADLERQGFQEALYNALRYGSPGQFNVIPTRIGSIEHKVDMYRGAPTILRSPGVRDMVDRERLASFFTHYFERLAFECALSNNRKGRLVLYYKNIPDDKFMVYDVMFHSRETILDEAIRRLELLESGTGFLELPPCPGWMTRFCEYAPECGCGDETRTNDS